MSVKKNKRPGHRGFWFCVILLLALAGWTLWGNTTVATTNYSYASSKLPKEFDGFRIVQISDLHDAQIGTQNERLLSAVRDARPDLIVLTGDILDSNRIDMELSASTAQKLTAIAPVYYVNGNHEASLIPKEYRRFTAMLREAGVTVLEDSEVELVRNGNSIRLVGLNDIGMHPGSIAEKESKLKRELAWLKDDDGFTVTLAHRADLFEDYVQASADLVLSGHAHGGQIRLPLLGGLYAPGQGLLPKYDSGIYTSGKTTMIVSRGIGNSTFRLRFNNRPEILVITLNCC